MVLVRNSADVKAVYNSSTSRSVSNSNSLHSRMLLGSRAVAFLMGDAWRAHRALLTKSFHMVTLKQMVADLSRVAVNACGFLHGSVQRGGGSCHIADLLDVTKAIAFDSVGVTSFGRDFGSLALLARGEIPPVADAFEFMKQEHCRRDFSMNPLASNYWLPTPANRRLARCRAVLRGVVDDVIAARRELWSRGEVGPDDLLQYLIKGLDEDTTGFVTHDSISDNMVTLLFAGVTGYPVPQCVDTLHRLLPLLLTLAARRR